MITREVLPARRAYHPSYLWPVAGLGFVMAFVAMRVVAALSAHSSAPPEPIEIDLPALSRTVYYDDVWCTGGARLHRDGDSVWCQR